MEAYGDDVMSGQQVAKWCCTFASCKDIMMDNNGSGPQNSLMTDVNTACIEELIQTDRQAGKQMWNFAVYVCQQERAQ
jgi:hypothetical protein